MMGGLRYVAIVSRFKEYQLTGDSKTGCQYDVQSGFAIMSEGYTDLCPVGVFLSVGIWLVFLRDKYVIGGFSHVISFNRKSW